jgi:hypothetical protein
MALNARSLLRLTLLLTLAALSAITSSSPEANGTAMAPNSSSTLMSSSVRTTLSKEQCSNFYDYVCSTHAEGLGTPNDPYYAIGKLSAILGSPTSPDEARFDWFPTLYD